jgi:hypothetical protein
LKQQVGKQQQEQNWCWQDQPTTILENNKACQKNTKPYQVSKAYPLVCYLLLSTSLKKTRYWKPLTLQKNYEVLMYKGHNLYILLCKNVTPS